jgi:hypothetical protein
MFVKEPIPPEAKVRGSKPLEHVTFFFILPGLRKKADLTLKVFSKNLI